MQLPGRLVVAVRTVALVGVSLLVSASASAQDPSTVLELEPEQDEVVGDWEPPLPEKKQFDWLQVRSGEWLKGEFELLRNRRVVFDSDEFDEIELDWHKVTSFYLPNRHTFRVEGRTLQGTAEMRGEVIRIRTEDGVAEFPRARLVSIARGAEGELSYWFAKIRADFGLRRGNTSQTDLGGFVEVRREQAMTRFTTAYRGLYGRVDGDTTAHNHRATTAFDIYLSRRLFVTVPFAEFLADHQQNIEARVTPGVAIGYEFVRNDWVELEAQVGPAYQYQLNESGSQGSLSSHDFAALFTSELEIDLPRDVDFDTSYLLISIPTDLDKTSHHLESVLSTDIWGPLDFDVIFTWDRIESPVKDNDGDRPKRDDYRVLVGFGLDF